MHRVVLPLPRGLVSTPITLRLPVRAPLDLVWATLVDVEEMPRWTPSVSSVVATSPGGPLSLGSRYQVKQPGMRELEWTVTRLEPGRVFRWTSRIGGVTALGDTTSSLSPTAPVWTRSSGSPTRALQPGSSPCRRTRRLVRQELRA